MAEGFDEFEMEDTSKKYPEYDTMRYLNLEDQVDSLGNELLDMDDRRETNLDEYKETNDRLKYAECVLENRTKNYNKLKNTQWIVDEDRNYKETNENVSDTDNIKIIKNTRFKTKIELYSKNVFRKNGELHEDKVKRRIQKDYVELTQSYISHVKSNDKIKPLLITKKD